MAGLEITPENLWLKDAPNGDILLCDVFTGDPLDPSKPSKAWTASRPLGDGYGLWMGNRLAEAGKVEQIGVYHVDPADIASRGGREKLIAAAGMFDVMLFAGMGSAIEDERRRRRTQPDPGRVNVGGEIAPDEDFFSICTEVGYNNTRMQTVPACIDPARDVQGNPDTPEGEALQIVRDRVLALELDPEHPSDSAARLAADLVYLDSLQWFQVLEAGRHIDELHKEGEFPESVLIVSPHESRAQVRKFHAISQLAGVVGVLARPEFDTDDDELYDEALAQGRLTHEMLEFLGRYGLDRLA